MITRHVSMLSNFKGAAEHHNSKAFNSPSLQAYAMAACLPHHKHQTALHTTLWSPRVPHQASISLSFLSKYKDSSFFVPMPISRLSLSSSRFVDPLSPIPNPFLAFLVLSYFICFFVFSLKLLVLSLEFDS